MEEDTKAKKKITYEDMGFNKFLKKGKPNVEMTEDQFSYRFPQVSAKNISGEVQTAAVEKAVDSLVHISALQEGSSVTISLNDGQQATLTSTIQSRTQSDRVMLGVVEMSIYIDAPGITANQIPYSYGLDLYPLYNRYDYHFNQLSSSPRIGLTYEETVLNSSGGTHTFYFIFRWR